ncbi:MAG: hypothetical protein NTU41_07330 [Chloroflexi bacterium]|nr:hypothetical protein [Chloroflexota bacterium]
MNFPSNLGVSEGAEAIQSQFRDVQDGFAQSVTIGGHYQETLESLAEAFRSCAADDWDGYGAKAIDPLSCRKAIDFSRLLPMSVPVPEISIDTDGEVRFEWYRGPRRVFSVAVGSGGELAYAGLFGASTTHGTEHFDDELPDAVLDNIYRACA